MSNPPQSTAQSPQLRADDVDAQPELDAADLNETLLNLYGIMRSSTPGPAMSLAWLGPLYAIRRFGPIRVTDLAAREGISQPGATQLVNKLRASGLVTTQTDSADGRAKLITLSDEGHRILQERQNSRTQRYASLIVELTPAEQHALARALPAMRRLAEIAWTATNASTEAPMDSTCR